MQNKINKLEKLISISKKILLINHIKMDPDGLGSLATLYFILEKMGKEVKATNDFPVQDDFAFLNANHIFEENLNIKEYNPDLIICLDSGSIGQLGEVYINNKELFEKKEVIVIDHHLTNNGFGDLNIINTEASSTCEILFSIIKELGLIKYIGKTEATLLLSGIITDTNIFFNNNTNKNSLKNAGELLSLGGDLRNIIYNFYKKISYNKIKLKGLIFNNIKEIKNGKIIWSIISAKDFESTGTNENDLSGIITDLISISGCEIAILISETKLGIKVSFRSINYDVGNFCSSFEGGGGHKNAAGFRLKTNLIEAEKIIFEKLKQIKI